MKIRIVILLFIILATTNQAYACSCGGTTDDFLTVSLDSKLVALVKINRYLTFDTLYGAAPEPVTVPMSMEAEIITVFHGKETRKTITVWGDNGYLCRPYLNRFKVGNYYIIAFQQCGNYEEEKETDYAISICGEYWLSADNEQKVAILNDWGKIGFNDLQEYFNGNITEALNDIFKQKYWITTIYQAPLFAEGDSVFRKFISDEIHKSIPERELPAKGSTSVLFTVTKIGEVERVVIVSQIDSFIKNKIIELTSKKWMGCKLNGMPIDVTLLLDIYWQKPTMFIVLHRPPTYVQDFM